MKDYSLVKSKYRNLKHWIEQEVGWCIFGIALFSLNQKYYREWMEWNSDDLLLLWQIATKE